jgi:hypothetical protein
MVILHREGASVPALLAHDGAPHAHLPGERATTAFAYAAGRTLCVVETPTQPGELTLIEVDGSHRCVTAENTGAARRFSRATFEGPFATPKDTGGVAWWRLLPAKPRRDHALVVQVHGGPHTSPGYGFSFEHHLLAARGYTVVTQNPRGSASYGADHALLVVALERDEQQYGHDHRQDGPGRDQPPVDLESALHQRQHLGCELLVLGPHEHQGEEKRVPHPRELDDGHRDERRRGVRQHDGLEDLVAGRAVDPRRLLELLGEPEQEVPEEHDDPPHPPADVD